MVLDTCDHIVVLNFGEVLADGTPDRIAADERVIEAYLGSADESADDADAAPDGAAPAGAGSSASVTPAKTTGREDDDD
jgi:branched-chain amino acid transport system permease protein